MPTTINKTPKWTTYPPYRPGLRFISRTRASQAGSLRLRRRTPTPRANSMKIVVATKTTAGTVNKTTSSRTPTTKSQTVMKTPLITGAVNCRLRLSTLARRQAMRGPIPMSTIIAQKSGPLTRLKYGVPTVTWRPNAAAIKGKTVPQKIAKHVASMTTLLARKLDSLESGETIGRSSASSGQRLINA